MLLEQADACMACVLASQTKLKGSFSTANDRACEGSKVCLPGRRIPPASEPQHGSLPARWQAPGNTGTSLSHTDPQLPSLRGWQLAHDRMAAKTSPPCVQIPPGAWPETGQRFQSRLCQQTALSASSKHAELWLQSRWGELHPGPEAASLRHHLIRSDHGRSQGWQPRSGPDMGAYA